MQQKHTSSERDWGKGQEEEGKVEERGEGVGKGWAEGSGVAMKGEGTREEDGRETLGGDLFRDLEEEWVGGGGWEGLLLLYSFCDRS